MVKVKFRVYEEKYCHNCKEVHPHRKHRELFYQPEKEGSEHDVIQDGHAWAVALLDGENRNRRISILRRPWFQYVLRIGE